MLSIDFRNAIMAMVDIASFASEASLVKLSDISRRQNITVKNLEGVLSILVKQGMLFSTSGPNGGYRLAKTPDNIVLLQILDCISKNEFKVTRCKGYGEDGCLKVGKKCKTHDLWYTIENQIRKLLQAVTITELLSNNVVKCANNFQDSNKRIYMDYNSTVPILDIAKNKFIEIISLPFNPSSMHWEGQQGRKLVENARSSVRKSINADSSYELIFTASGTEANNLVFNNNLPHVISSIEHTSIMKSAKNPYLIPVDNNGLIITEKLEEVLSKIGVKAIVSVIYANNETGVVQDIKEIGRAHV